MRLLTAWLAGRAIIHTALDDMESFFWILIWGIVHASKNIEGAMDSNPGIQDMLSAWSGDVPMGHNLNKLSFIRHGWQDAVFGGLIKEWLNTFYRAHEESQQIIFDMSRMRPGCHKWDNTCNKFESYCEDIYKEVLESGFRYLEGVREYPSWDKVVAANVRTFGEIRQS